MEGSYPEAVLVAADVEVLYDDLGAVSDLTAAVGAEGFTGPGKEQESDFPCTTRRFQSRCWYQQLLPRSNCPCIVPGDSTEGQALSRGAETSVAGQHRPQSQRHCLLPRSLPSVLVIPRTHPSSLRKQNLTVVSGTPEVAPRCPTWAGQRWPGSWGGRRSLSPDQSSPQGCRWRRRKHQHLAGIQGRASQLGRFKAGPRGPPRSTVQENQPSSCMSWPVSLPQLLSAAEPPSWLCPCCRLSAGVAVSCRGVSVPQSHARLCPAQLRRGLRRPDNLAKGNDSAPSCSLPPPACPRAPHSWPGVGPLWQPGYLPAAAEPSRPAGYLWVPALCRMGHRFRASAISSHPPSWC